MIETKEFQFYIITRPVTIGNCVLSNCYLMPDCLASIRGDLTGLFGEWVA